MRAAVESCDLGLSRGRSGTCSVDTAVTAPRPPLRGRQRAARAVAGVAFIAAARPLLRMRASRPAGALTAWFGVSHLLAAATAFNGCPELGAVPSLLLRRDVATECGPWEWLDERLGLAR